jgi:GT2 family glycosyltransferase
MKGLQDPALMPDLSIVITSWNARPTIEGCLDSLRLQATRSPFEIILVDSSTDGTAELVRQNYPEVRLVSSPSRLYCGEARNMAIPAARAGIIAFLDADCTVESGWVDAILAAHRDPGLLVAGTVENGTPESLVAWAYYFCEFNLWLPGKGERDVAEGAGCCLSFKKKAWEAYGPFLTGTYSSDTAFHWKARAEGHRVRNVPAIRVFHRVLHGFRDFLRHVAHHRCCYARVKVREFRLGPTARLARCLFAPILPLLLLATIAARVAASGRFHREFLACLPLFYAGLCARAWGEFRGFAAGEGDGVVFPRRRSGPR